MDLTEREVGVPALDPFRLQPVDQPVKNDLHDRGGPNNRGDPVSANMHVWVGSSHRLDCNANALPPRHQPQTVIPLSASAFCAAFIASHSSSVMFTPRAWLPLYSPRMPAAAIASINRDARL